MKTKFGLLLRRTRMAAGLSMGQLARHLQVSVSYLSDIELGDRAPFAKDKIVAAAEKMGVDPGELLAAASQTRGAYELDARVSQKAQVVGAALMRGWNELTDDQLDGIAGILNSAKGSRDDR